MTSFRQIQANRRNALKSTGPSSEEGKQQSRRNAVRHGLTAETVIGALEDAEDYKAFEAAIIADYDAESAVERELVLRLASLLWRLRRATTMETGLFQIQAEQLLEFGQDRQADAGSRKTLLALFKRTASVDCDRAQLDNLRSRSRATSGSEPNSADPGADLASCFLGLANLPSHALDRLSRYEAILWRQARQTVFALDALGRRRPQDRGHHFHCRNRHQRSIDEHEER
jgi:hypothetical protein